MDLAILQVVSVTFNDETKNKKNIQMINQYCGNLCIEIEKKIHEVDGDISDERKRPDNIRSAVLVHYTMKSRDLP